MCSALLSKAIVDMLYVFSAFFSTHHTKIRSLTAASYSKVVDSVICGLCFSKQSQKLAMISRAQICRIHASEARYKRPSAIVHPWPSLRTTSFIFTKITRIGTHGRLCASQITRRPIHVLSSFVVAKYIVAMIMENQDPFRKTTVGFP